MFEIKEVDLFFDLRFLSDLHFLSGFPPKVSVQADSVKLTQLCRHTLRLQKGSLLTLASVYFRHVHPKLILNL